MTDHQLLLRRRLITSHLLNR